MKIASDGSLTVGNSTAATSFTLTDIVGAAWQLITGYYDLSLIILTNAGNLAIGITTQMASLSLGTTASTSDGAIALSKNTGGGWGNFRMGIVTVLMMFLILYW